MSEKHDEDHGYLPGVYKRFVDEHPQLADAFWGLAEQEHTAGPLDDRSRRLVKLGIAIGAASQGAVRSHARRALAEGFSADEVRHAALLAITTVGFPQAIAALGWVDEVLAS